MSELPAPKTREEQYLSKIVGENTPIPTPITREEFYFAKIAGENVEIPTDPQTEREQYLAAIAGLSIIPPPPRTRVAQFLAKIAGGNNEVPIPITREEMYLAQWAEQGGSNDNILVNWYLPDPVNQRQVSSFSLGKYGADMWKCTGSTITLTESGFSVPNKAQVLQYIPLDKLEVGETYTMTLKLAADVSHVESGWSREGSIQFKLYSSAYSSTNHQKITLDEGKVFTKTFTVPENQALYYGINIDGGNGYLNEPIVVEAVKLEKGEVSTLAKDSPPNKEEELRLCQEWLQFFPNGTVLYNDRFDYDPVMYADPTVTTEQINGVTYATATCELGRFS